MASFGLPRPPKISSPLPMALQPTQKPLLLASFPVSDSKSRPALVLTAPHFQGCYQSRPYVFKTCAQLTEAVDEKISNGAPALDTAPLNSQNPPEVPASSLSVFMAQVTDLIKLVDSRDVVELQLKQLDCEVIIRKKEAMPLPSVAPPVFYAPPVHQAIQSPSLNPAGHPTQASTPRPTPAAPVKPKSPHPPFKCPMAGNFYRSSAPGAPPFVKVGDKVQKGQVLCIIEAMKLMNEIEADQSGTVVEVLAEDGKPVSVDTPLFIIEP